MIRSCATVNTMKSGQAQPALRAAVATTRASPARSRVPSVRRHLQLGHSILCLCQISNLTFQIPSRLLPLSFSLSVTATYCLATRHSALALVLSQISNLKSQIPFGHSPPGFPVSRVNIGSSARCYRVTDSTPALPAKDCLATRHSTLALVLSQISNLTFQVPFSLLPLAFSLSVVTPVNIGSSARCYRVTNSTPALPAKDCLATRHSNLALLFSQISNLKSQISFGLSHDPSLIPQHPSRKPEYPPLSRNIPPYPRISPLPFVTHNRFQHSHIHLNGRTRLGITPLDFQPLPWDASDSHQWQKRVSLPEQTSPIRPGIDLVYPRSVLHLFGSPGGLPRVIRRRAILLAAILGLGLNHFAIFARAHGMRTYKPRQGRKAATVVCSASAVVTLAFFKSSAQSAPTAAPQDLAS